MKLVKNIIRIVLGLAFLLALIFWIIRHRVSEQMMHPKRFLVKENIEQFKRGFLPSDYSIKHSKPIRLFGTDSTTLSAYFIPALHNNKAQKTIIGLHDLGSCKEHLFTMARWAQNEGFNVLIFDIRAHGKSEGAYFTYGKKEHKDLIKIIDWIKNEDAKQDIGLWGFSSGANIAIQAMAIDERIGFAILENPYPNNQQLASSQHPYIPTFINTAAFRRTEKLLEISNDQNPIKLASKVKQNILMVHGEKHPSISSNKALELFQQLAGKNNEYFPVKGAHHYNLWHYGGKELETRFRSFLAKQ